MTDQRGLIIATFDGDVLVDIELLITF
jgi:hypothetical protein